MTPVFEFTILGQPYIKKSNQRTVWNGRRIVRVDTPRYKSWHAQALGQLAIIKRPIETLDRPLILSIQFYLKTRGVCDLSALYEGIQDVMVEVGIISDDNYKIIAGHDGSRVHHDKDNPRMEVKLLELT